MAAVSPVVADVLKAWHEWGIQALVLVSFTLQVMLLVLAEFRRWVDSGALRFLAWSAYILADSTAIFVLGHLSVMGRSPEHELVAFWAPFLLIHLGGQDNITAYAIEDIQLWLRHLLTLGVQVSAAAYVLYMSSIIVGGGHSNLLLRWATGLVFLVGVAKYAERVWALRCAGRYGPSSNNYRPTVKGHTQSAPINLRNLFVAVKGGPSSDLRDLFVTPSWDTEDCLLMAHQMLGVPKELFKGIIYQVPHREAAEITNKEGRLYKVAEMQLSLMHDVFYTKAEVATHRSLCGIFVHMLLPVLTAVAFLLFLVLHRHGQLDGYSRVDIAVTYVLLVGALVLEAVSALRCIFSSWACVLLLKHYSSSVKARQEEEQPAAAQQEQPSSFFRRFLLGIPPVKESLFLWSRWIYLASIGCVGRAVLYLRRLVRAADWGSYWSGSVGQHNLLQLATGSLGAGLAGEAG